MLQDSDVALSSVAARDGDSTGTGGSSSGLPESERAESEVEKTLRSQLASLKEEKDRVSDVVVTEM